MKELLFSVTKKDLEIQTFCSGGKGGQHQNKVETGVRIIHRESGAVGEARDSRSQHGNKKAAFLRMVNSKEFKMWHKQKTREILEQRTVDQKVDEMMADKNILVEIQDDRGRWIHLNGECGDND